MRRGRLLLLALALLGAAAALRWPSLDLPLDRDEGEYASLAWLWSDGHGLPYRDWLQQKPPASIGVNAVAQAVFADGLRGLRWVSLAWVAATVLALGLLLLQLLRLDPQARHSPVLAALGAGAIAALLLSASRTQSLGANTESWLSLPLIAAFSVAWGGTLGPGRLLAAGALIGVASLFKQPVLAAVLILPWALRPGEGRLLPTVAWTSLGALLPWALVTALFASQGGALALLNCTWAYNQGYVAQGWSGALGRGWGVLRWLGPELGAVAALASLGAWGLSAGPLRRALLAWLGLGLLLFVVGGRFYPHYAIGLLAPLAALAGLALAQPGRRALRGGLAALGFAGWLYCNAQLWAAPDGGARSVHLFGLSNFAAAPQAAARLQAISTPDKPLFIWGDEPQLYYLAKRVPATRFLYTYPFTGEAPAWPDGPRELRAALHSPWIGAAVLAKPLDARDPLQMEIEQVLQERFDPDNSVPPFILGRPKP